PVGLLAEQLPLAGHQKSAVGQPVDAVARDLRAWGDHFAVAVEVDGEDLLFAPVREPQPALVPARRLSHTQAGQQRTCFGHRAHPLDDLLRDLHPLHEERLAGSTHPAAAPTAKIAQEVAASVSWTSREAAFRRRPAPRLRPASRRVPRSMYGCRAVADR